jgi:hypothetical protein
MTGLSSAEQQIQPVYSGNARRGHIAFTALACIVMLLLSALADGGGDAGDKEVLKGITRIGVEVEDLPRVAEKLGIKKETLKMDVASRLHTAGIEVASDDMLKQNPSLPFLKVSLIMGYSKPTYIYAVVVGLNEKVFLERDPRIISYAMPWWRIVKGEHAGESTITGYVQETLAYIINEFIADYTAANTATNIDKGENSQRQQGDHRFDSQDQEKKPLPGHKTKVMQGIQEK